MLTSEDINQTLLILDKADESWL